MAGRVAVVNDTAGAVLADRATMADTFTTRLVGLLGRVGLAAGEGLVLKPCQAVHTLFMRFPIDVIFVDPGLRVVRTTSALAPYRQSAYQRDAKCIIELPSGTIASSGTKVGDQLHITTI